jgi:hypothetical protein
MKTYDVGEMALPHESNGSRPGTNPKRQTSIEDDKTIKLSLEQIQLPAQMPVPQDPASSDRQTSFAFEKARLRELGPEMWGRSNADGPVTDVDKQDPRAVELKQRSNLAVEREVDTLQCYSRALKTLCLIILCWSFGQVIFSIVYTFVLALHGQLMIMVSTIPLITNALISVWMIYISLKGNSASLITPSPSPLLVLFIKLSMLTIILLCAQFVTMGCVQSISELFISLFNINSSSYDERTRALQALGYVISWVTSLLNLCCSILCLVLALTFKRVISAKELHDLERKVLPLGYQIYAQLPHLELSNVRPYCI